MIKPKGRPVSQCPHCREARRNHALHTKCDCPGDKHSAGKISKSSSCQCPHGGGCDCSKLKNAGRSSAASSRRTSKSKTASTSPSPGPSPLSRPQYRDSSSSSITQHDLKSSSIDENYYPSEAESFPIAPGNPNPTSMVSSYGATDSQRPSLPEMSVMFDNTNDSLYARDFFAAASPYTQGSAVDASGASRPTSATLSLASAVKASSYDSDTSSIYSGYNSLPKSELSGTCSTNPHYMGQQPPSTYADESSYGGLDPFVFHSTISGSSAFNAAASLPTGNDYYLNGLYVPARSSQISSPQGYGMTSQHNTLAPMQVPVSSNQSDDIYRSPSSGMTMNGPLSSAMLPS